VPTQNTVRILYAQGKQRMVRKLLALGYNMHYQRPETQEEHTMPAWKVCMKHVDRWLLSEKSQVRKRMNDMTYRELRQAVTQFQIVHDHYQQNVHG
jgi:hypothetical protein